MYHVVHVYLLRKNVPAAKNRCHMQHDFRICLNVLVFVHEFSNISLGTKRLRQSADVFKRYDIFILLCRNPICSLLVGISKD